MKLLRQAAAAMIAVASLTAGGPSYAAPAVQAPVAVDGLVVQVRGCHDDVQRHRVPEFGDRRAWHYHRGRRCRPIEVERPDFDPEPVRDCHREVRRHYVPEVGRSVVHRHRGPRCRIEIFQRYDRPRPDGACVVIGGFSFCTE